MALLSLEQIIAAIADELGTDVPTFTGGPGDVPRHTGHDRYVWTRFVVRPDGANAGQSYAVPGQARPIGADAWTCEVHCRSTTLARAEHLRAALATAAREVLGRQATVENTEIEPPNADEVGWVARVELVIRRPLLTAMLPVEFADANTGKATIVAVAHDPTGATTGDGTMQVAETP